MVSATTATAPGQVGLSEAPPAALKEMFDAQLFRRIANDLAAIWPPFDAVRFLQLGLHDLAQLSLMQRLRRVTLALR